LDSYFTLFSTLNGNNFISLRFNGHFFPGELGLASFIAAKGDGGGGDNWSYKTCNGAKLQSNRHHQQTNTQLL